MALVPNKPTPENRSLGEQLARFYDEAEPKAHLKQPAPPVRCAQCVFRKGTLPFGRAPTTMGALKCALEREMPFLCAHRERAPDGEFHECAGWQAIILADDITVEAPWDFSDKGVADATP